MIALAFLPLVIWLFLLTGRGMFWLMRERDTLPLPLFGREGKGKAAVGGNWPTVAAIVPARDEADVIGRSITSLLAQDYPGAFRVILVDDQSADGTAAIARALPSQDRLTVVVGSPRPAGWTGKLWAIKQGILLAGEPDYLWLTDADIAHTPDNLEKPCRPRRDQHKLVLVSLMAKTALQKASPKS